MSRKILANDGIDETGKALLEKAGFEVIIEKVAQDKLVEAINKEDFVALTVRSATKVRKELIDACPGLKVIGRGGVGMDNIDALPGSHFHQASCIYWAALPRCLSFTFSCRSFSRSIRCRIRRTSGTCSEPLRQHGSME